MTDSCVHCPLVPRRDFITGAFAFAAGLALPVRFARGVRLDTDEHAYPIPDADTVSIDKDLQVIVVRYQQKAYAFNLSCPHQNTALRWHPEDGQFQCPKHHSRYQPDGIFISGRATRSMDRFAVRRDAANMVVDLDQLYRQDQNPAEWGAAFLSL
ncbi:MAG TPA: Rieske 2Fe-2S domain-containing protein [Gemmatimonadales bacterium]|nr:Rieske 2Fe-2S domain-containing protein [Gemmatimonadales bacterium]